MGFRVKLPFENHFNSFKSITNRMLSEEEPSWVKRGIKISCGGVSEKKGKVRGKVNLAIPRKRSVVEQNGIKIWTLRVNRGIEEA